VVYSGKPGLVKGTYQPCRLFTLLDTSVFVEEGTMRLRGFVSLLFFVCIAAFYPAYAQKIVNQFEAPGGTPRGLAWDGTHLWCADERANAIYKLNPSTGSIVSSISFSIESGKGGLTWSSDGNLWIANGLLVHKVDPNTGDPLGTVQCPGS